LRRFTFNIAFRALDYSALRAAWQHFFGSQVAFAPAVLALSNLTPGDFAQARKRLELLGDATNSDAIAHALEEASLAKPGSSRVMGFSRLTSVA
jgi:hypothetical protein